jgi:cytochrome c oxidase subunit 1
VGSWVLVAGVLVLLGNFIVALLKGEKAPANPWDGISLEWTIPSPPTVENFEEVPTITQPPYQFNPVVPR